MEPTPKALSLEAPIRTLLDGLRELRADQATFVAATSNRAFSFAWSTLA